MISKAPDDTSSVEWLLHRLLLSGSGGNSAKYVNAKFNQVKAFTRKEFDDEVEE